MIFEVMVDWDIAHWALDPDFAEAYDDISTDIDTDGIIGLNWQRGKEKEEGNAPAATLDVTLRRGLCDKYSPFTTGVLAGKVRPWVPIRVRIYHDAAWVPVYYGFIEKITIDPALAVQSTTFYCTDGTDLLARQLITQDPDSKTIMSDGDAIEKILDAAGWSLTRRSIDKDGGDDLLGYPACHPY